MPKTMLIHQFKNEIIRDSTKLKIFKFYFNMDKITLIDQVVLEI